VFRGTSIQLTCSNLYRMSVAFFPPAPEILSNMCRQGFDDALRYLQKNSEYLSVPSPANYTVSLKKQSVNLLLNRVPVF